MLSYDIDKANRSNSPKKAEAALLEQELGSVGQTTLGEAPLSAPSKRGRKKKTADEYRGTAETEARVTPSSNGNAPQASTDSETGAPLAKPKRTKRVGNRSRSAIRSANQRTSRVHGTSPAGDIPGKPGA